MTVQILLPAPLEAHTQNRLNDDGSNSDACAKRADDEVFLSHCGSPLLGNVQKQGFQPAESRRKNRDSVLAEEEK
jgi:hypothetical protein